MPLTTLTQAHTVNGPVLQNSGVDGAGYARYARQHYETIPLPDRSRGAHGGGCLRPARSERSARVTSRALAPRSIGANSARTGNTSAAACHSHGHAARDRPTTRWRVGNSNNHPGNSATIDPGADRATDTAARADTLNSANDSARGIAVDCVPHSRDADSRSIPGSTQRPNCPSTIHCATCSATVLASGTTWNAHCPATTDGTARNAHCSTTTHVATNGTARSTHCSTTTESSCCSPTEPRSSGCSKATRSGNGSHAAAFLGVSKPIPRCVLHTPREIHRCQGQGGE